jgi:hypothetical protein
VIVRKLSTGTEQYGTIGALQSVQNEYCYVKTSESTVDNSLGFVSDVSLKIGFLGTISGGKEYLISMLNGASVDTGWLYQGVWTIPQQVNVTVSPSSALISSGQGQQFNANVTGTSNTAVGWTPFGWGSVTSSGYFIANTVTSTQNTILRATSQADNTKYADANLTIQPAPVLVTITNFYPQNLSGRSAVFNISANGGNSPINFLSFYANITQLNSGGCKVTWYPASNLVSLTENNGYYTQSNYLGSWGSLTNSYCSINLQSSYGSYSGNNATLTLSVNYNYGFFGGWINHWARAGNNAGISMADWQSFGYWWLPY